MKTSEIKTMASLSLRNAARHRLSSIVLGGVFTMSSLVLFWVFGFSNHIVNNLEDMIRRSYGDIAVKVPWSSRAALGAAVNAIPGVTGIVTERELPVMLDGEGQSGMAMLLELTPQNHDQLARYIRPDKGRLPVAADEIAVTDFLQNMVFKLGDRVYVTTPAASGVLNTLPMRVVGILHGTALKSAGFGYVVSELGMSTLVDSSDQANLVYLNLSDSARRASEIDGHRQRVIAQLEAVGIKPANGYDAQDSWTSVERMEQFKIFAEVFSHVKTLMLLIVFPLLGAVVAAIVWVYAMKRRREIWTGVSLGMRDRVAFTVFGMEYVLVAGIGALLGIALGYFTAWIAWSTNAWLMFSYTMSISFRAEVHWHDALIIFTFLIALVLFWIRGPVRRIIRTVPFSY